MPDSAAAPVLPFVAADARPGASTVVFAIRSNLLVRGSASWLPGGRRFLLLRGHEVAQAFVLLGAGRAARQMRAHAWDGGIGVAAGKLDLDVAVELVEAGLASELGVGGAEQAAEQVVGHGSSPPSARRSLRRASCSGL